MTLKRIPGTASLPSLLLCLLILVPAIVSVADEDANKTDAKETAPTAASPAASPSPEGKPAAEKTNEKVALPAGAEKTDKEKQDALSRAITIYGDSPRVGLDQEEARRQYEQILAEEEAREQARIDEERKREPLVDNFRELQQIDKTDRIWITGDRKSVVLLGRVAFRDGLLELLACRIGTKEHESVVSVRVKPFLIHFGLLLCGAEPGKPVQQSPAFVPPSGDEIEIRIRWKDEDGKPREVLAQEWVLDLSRSKQDDEGNWTEKHAMSTHWVFTGSMMYKDDAGLNHYVADESGELFGLSNFVGSILDVPIRSSAENAELMFGCYTERIPELDTPLTLILTPTKNRKADADEKKKKDETATPEKTDEKTPKAESGKKDGVETKADTAEKPSEKP